MAANLTAIFRAVDEISGKLDAMASSGSAMATQLQNAGSAADNAFSSASAGGVSAAHSVEGVAQSAGSLSDRMDDAESSSDELTRSLEGFDDNIGDATDSTDNLAHAADNAADSMEDLGRESEDAGKKGEDAGQKGSEAIGNLQNALVAAGIAKLLQEIAEGFAATVEASMEFESAVTGVYKTVDGTAEQLAAISEETKALSTVMPATTTEIAGVAEAAGQLGIATDDIMNFTEVMINLGEATNLTSDEASSSLAKFANITGMAADSYENLGSTIVALGNSFATTEADITAMATRMASAGTLAGLSEPEILALAASLSAVGIEADAGGSAMSQLLTQMQVAVETGSEQLDNFAFVAGESAEEFQQSWGENAVDALYSFISGLNDTERTGKTATVMLSEMGITEIRLSNAIKSLASNSDGLSSALDKANDAWVVNTALANEAELRYSTLESKMAMAKNASNNLSIAFGNVLAPSVEKVTEWYTDATIAVTGFVEEHPAVVAVITGVAVALGVAAVAITGYVFVTKLAIPAITAFNAALTANPVGAVIMGVVALTAGIAALIAVIAGAQEEQVHWTASTRKQYDELDALNAEYEEACEVYGETSEEARYLAWEIDNLNESIEANKQTFEEYVEELNNTRDSLDDMLDSNRKAYQEIDDNEGTTLALVGKLEELAAQTVQTVETQEQMKAIIDELNETVPGLSLNYEDVIGNVEDFGAAIEQAVKAQAAAERYEAAQKSMVDAYNAQYDAQQQLARIEEERALAQAEYEEEYARWQEWNEDSLFWIGSGGRGNNPYEEEASRAKKAYQTAEDELEELDSQTQSYNATLEQAQADYDMYLEALTEYAEYTYGAADATMTYEEAVSAALTSVQGEMDELVKAYDAAYEAARTNIDGTIGLFETAEIQAGLSSEAIIAAWQSQIDFFNGYKENLEALENLGVDPELLKELSDGSAESVGQVQALADELAGLDTAGAAEAVDTINEKFGELSTAKDEAAAVMAGIQTDFDARLAELETSLTTAINDMNMDAESAEAARSTMAAYTQAIRDGTAGAVTAAEAAAAAVAAALDTSYTGGTTTTVQGHASGTTYAEDVFIAGENGPELILGAGGSTVFPTDETDRIINAVNKDRGEESAVPAGLFGAGGSTGTSDDSSSVKKVLLEIAGKGNIEVSGSTDKETLLAFLYEYLKPVLSEILTQEIFEEGDASYEY